MSAYFEVNWMTSSIIIYAKLIIQIKVCNFLTTFVLISSFFTLFLILFLFEAVNTCFLLISRKFAAFLLKIKCLKNPRWLTCCETTVAIATVLKEVVDQRSVTWTVMFSFEITRNNAKY